MVDVKYYYCHVCKKEIDNPIRKPMDTLEKIIWVIIILATVGFGLIPFFLYRYYIKPKNRCPNCVSKLESSEQPFSEPEEEIEAKTPREKILKKAGKTKEIQKEREKAKKRQKRKETGEKEKKSRPSKCPYCGNRLDPDEEDLFCQFCGAKL